MDEQTTPQPDSSATVTLLDGNALVVKYEITSGEILVSVLLTMLIFVFLLKWGHELILGGRKHVRS